MTTGTRRERERSERHDLIVATARELAEAEGWEAVTIRRLAERIEYSQPVLYSHFAGKSAILTAVAEAGFAELAAKLRAAYMDERSGVSDEAEFVAVAVAYIDFAYANPALYDAMFVLKTDLVFGPDAPVVLKQAFAGLLAAFKPFADGDDPETFTEVAWATLHGLATLERGRRLRPEHQEERLRILVERLSALRG